MKTPCPVNHEHHTSPFSSYQDLYCHECGKFYPWLLKEGQPPLLASHRDKRKDK